MWLLSKSVYKGGSRPKNTPNSVYVVCTPPLLIMYIQFNFCRYHVPVAFYVLHNFHYLFLVFNSSINFVIYCLVSKDFRTKMLQMFLSWISFVKSKLGMNRFDNRGMILDQKQSISIFLISLKQSILDQSKNHKIAGSKIRLF